MDFKGILTASTVLFAVIVIVESTPIIISLREKAGHVESEKASLVAALIMIAILFWEKKYWVLSEWIYIHLRWLDPLLFSFWL